jgi:hypothetical protein
LETELWFLKSQYLKTEMRDFILKFQCHQTEEELRHWTENSEELASWVS